MGVHPFPGFPALFLHQASFLLSYLTWLAESLSIDTCACVAGRGMEGVEEQDKIMLSKYFHKNIWSHFRIILSQEYV